MKIKKQFLVLISFFILVYITIFFIYLSREPEGLKQCPPNLSNVIESSFLENLEHLKENKKSFFIDDASCLNKTEVFAIVRPSTENDIKDVLDFARNNNLHISISAVRHSMGGQSFYKNSIVVDMMNFNKILNLDIENKIIKVQSGATWHEIQNYIDPYKLSIKSMQSSDIFSVGGSISVNAHGMDHRFGSVSSTIKSINVMLADGTIQLLTRDNNSELFNLVIGGYGLFGIILETEIELTDNAAYVPAFYISKYDDLPNEINEIISNPLCELFYVHLSTDSKDLLEEAILYAYYKVNIKDSEISNLKDPKKIKLYRFIINLSKRRVYGKKLKWFFEKYIGPYSRVCTIDVGNKINKNCLISRNTIMHDSVVYLRHAIYSEVDILHEYFIPRNTLISFINGMRDTIKKSKITLLNASIRLVNKENIFLNYAPENMYSIVLYFNQKRTEEDTKIMQNLTKELINLAIKHNGTFFLPYQLHYTKGQLEKAYPMINEFFALKKKYDSKLLFMNEFYAKYILPENKKGSAKTP